MIGGIGEGFLWNFKKKTPTVFYGTAFVVYLKAVFNFTVDDFFNEKSIDKSSFHVLVMWASLTFCSLHEIQF